MFFTIPIAVSATCPVYVIFILSPSYDLVYTQMTALRSILHVTETLLDSNHISILFLKHSWSIILWIKELN
jgi:hypothetical protein